MLCFVCLFLPVSIIALANTSGWSTLERNSLSRREKAVSKCVFLRAPHRDAMVLFTTRKKAGSRTSRLVNEAECKSQYWIKVKLQLAGLGRQKVCYQSHNYLNLDSTTNPRLSGSRSFPWGSPPPVASGQCHLELFVWRLTIHPHQNHTHKTETIKHLPVQVSQNVTYALRRRPVLNDQREQPGVNQRRGTELLSDPLHFKQHLIRNTL